MTQHTAVAGAEEEELTEAKCDDRLREIKDEMDQAANIPRDTSFDRSGNISILNTESKKYLSLGGKYLSIGRQKIF